MEVRVARLSARGVSWTMGSWWWMLGRVGSRDAAQLRSHCRRADGRRWGSGWTRTMPQGSRRRRSPSRTTSHPIRPSPTTRPPSRTTIDPSYPTWARTCRAPTSSPVRSCSRTSGSRTVPRARSRRSTPRRWIEEGRYITRPDQHGNPSRTSVNLNGDVAIANRAGGVTKIYARTDDCTEATEHVERSPADVKPWPDECVGWHTPLAYASQRPVAWARGARSTTARAAYDNARLWTSGANATDRRRALLDGETGVDRADRSDPGVTPSVYGIYGGAVDAATTSGARSSAVVSSSAWTKETFAVQTLADAGGGYGMTVDRTIACGRAAHQVGRFDYPSRDVADGPGRAAAAAACPTAPASDLARERSDGRGRHRHARGRADPRRARTTSTA